MIYKNNEPSKLNKEEQKKYAKRTVYLLMPHLAKYDHQDGRLRKPNAMILEPNYTWFDSESGQSVEIRYAKTAPLRKNENGKTYDEWNPSQLEFPQSGRMIVDANDPELNYFWANHPANEGNEKRNLDRPSIFYPEDLAEKARKFVKKEKEKHDAIALIFDDKNGMDEKNLRIVAGAYPDLAQQAGDKDFTIYQLKAALSVKADTDPEHFLRASRNPRTKMKFLMNAAINAKMLRYSVNKKSWFKVENEVEKELVYQVLPGRDPVESMIDFLQNEDKNNYAGYFEAKLDRTPVFS